MPKSGAIAVSRVLVVDDDQETREGIATLLAGWGCTVRTAQDGFEALSELNDFAPHVMLTDLMMPRMNGFELLEKVGAEGHQLPVIVLTAFGNMEIALRTVHQLGAFWFLEKPVEAQPLRVLLERAVAQSALQEDAERLRRQLSYQGVLADLVGGSDEMQHVFSLIRQVAPTTAPVLITGESGTGKELAARAIHQLSARSRGPFVAVNCAALPESLIESEVFGHEAGAFTGAVTRRAGCFELANHGTLLLDEVGEIPVRLQAKLLRVLEDSKVRRLGATSEVTVDVRVIAATNMSLEKAMAEGEFRKDLFFRLNVFHVRMPALRDRPEDLPGISSSLIAQINDRHGLQVTGLDDDALELLHRHPWPGNVRELRNILERAVILARKGTLTPAHLPAAFGRVEPAAPVVPPSDDSPAVRLPLGTTLPDAEEALIQFTLSHTGNDKTRAAEILGISRKTIFNRLREYREREKVETERHATA